jgi:hypothetical protein
VFERALQWRWRAGTFRDQEPDVLGANPPRNERQRIGRRRIEPLEIVDRDQQRLARCQ